MSYQVSDQEIEQILRIAVENGLGDGGFYGPDTSFTMYRHHPFKDMNAADFRRLMTYNATARRELR